MLAARISTAALKFIPSAITDGIKTENVMQIPEMPFQQHLACHKGDKRFGSSEATWVNVAKNDISSQERAEMFRKANDSRSQI